MTRTEGHAPTRSHRPQGERPLGNPGGAHREEEVGPRRAGGRGRGVDGEAAFDEEAVARRAAAGDVGDFEDDAGGDRERGRRAAEDGEPPGGQPAAQTAAQPGAQSGAQPVAIPRDFYRKTAQRGARLRPCPQNPVLLRRRGGAPARAGGVPRV